MKDRERKEVIAFAVFMVTFAGLLFGFYNGIRADMREMRTEMQAMNNTLSDVRERLAVIETHIGIATPGPAEQGPVGNDAVEEGAVEQGGTVKVVRALVPASLTWLLDVYHVRSVGNASSLSS